jgi:hypothetical protein
MKRTREDSDDDDHEDVTPIEKRSKDDLVHVRIGVLTNDAKSFEVATKTMTKDDVDIFRVDTGLRLDGLTFEFIHIDCSSASSRFYAMRDALLEGPGVSIDVVMMDANMPWIWRENHIEFKDSSDAGQNLKEFIERDTPMTDIFMYLARSHVWKEKTFWFDNDDYELRIERFRDGDPDDFSQPVHVIKAEFRVPLMILGNARVNLLTLYSSEQPWIDSGLIEYAEKKKKKKGKTRASSSDDDDGISTNFKWTPKAMAIVRRASLHPFYHAIFKAVAFKDAMRQKPIAKKIRIPGVSKPVYQSPLEAETEKLVIQYLGKAKEAPKKQKLLLVDSSSDSDSD